MANSMKLIIDPEGVATIMLDVPEQKVNTLSQKVMQELETIIDEISENKYIKALLIRSAKEDSFIAGADIREFEYFFSDQEAIKTAIYRGHRILNKIESLTFPTIAVIHGVCFGGGMELSLACRYRVATDHPKTKLALPEVNLGIFPGWGGTQRMPRLVGLEEGIKMVVTGKPVDGRKAFKIGLADALFAKEFLEESLNRFVFDCIKDKRGRKKRKSGGLRAFLLEKNPLGRALIYHLTKKEILKKTKGFYPSPLAAVDLIKRSYTKSLKKGLDMEKSEFLESVKDAFVNAKNLIKLYFMNESIKKDPGVPEKAQSKSIKSVGVIGAGIMGSGISWAVSNNDLPVRMKDIDWKAVGRGYRAIWENYSFLTKRRKLTCQQALFKFHKVAGCVDYSGFQDVDLVIEAAVENLELKQKIFDDLESVVKKDAIIASNTSSLLLTEIAEKMRHPERAVVMHFFNPVNRMPLVEVVAGQKTHPDAVATAVSFCQAVGKTPIVVGECHGFLVNRTLAPALIEPLFLLQEGVNMEKIEKSWLNFGMPMGAFSLADEIGLDVNLKVIKTFEKAYGDRMQKPRILEELVSQNAFGKKSGKGFYVYNVKNKTVNPEVEKLIRDVQKKELPSGEIMDRVLFAMINEASMCLEENVADKPEKVDMALILGTGFPPFRGGLLRYADQRGIHTVVEGLKRYHELHGARYKPSQLLLEMDRKNNSFY